MSEVIDIRTRAPVPTAPLETCQPPTAAGWRPRFCEGMRIALAGVPDNFGGKGLHPTRGWIGERATTPPSYLGVIYRRRTQDPGIVLNLCPWCGASVRFDEEPVR